MTHPGKVTRTGMALLLLCCLLLSCLGLPVGAEASAAPESARVGVAYLCCLDTGAVLYEKAADQVIYPASTVKIMTGLLVCQRLGDRLDETVTLTAAMLSGTAGRSLHLAEGEVLTVRDLLYAALCGGYNDAVNALAVIAYGSVSSFVALMNQEAARLGATHTVYTNPTGLHDEAMVTTARDTALIAREAWGEPLFMEVTSTTSYTMSATNVSDSRTVYNRNALLSDTSQNYRNGYCRGMSAGMTDEGGWCVVTVYQRGGATLLSVVMQGADVASGEIIPAYTYTNSLLSWARSRFGMVEVLTAGQVMDRLSVDMTGLSSSKAELVVVDALSVYLPLDVSVREDLVIGYTLDGDHLSAPLYAGDRVGLVTVRYQDQVVATAPLTVTEDFEINGFLQGMMSFRRYLTSRPFFAALVIFAVLIFLYIRLWRTPTHPYGVRNMKKRRSRW